MILVFPKSHLIVKFATLRNMHKAAHTAISASIALKLNFSGSFKFHLKSDNVRVIPDAGDIEIVGADKIAKLSAETSEDRSVAAWDQRIVIRRFVALE